MAENGTELRRIAWSQALPFVRLFQTLRLALNVNRLILALLCIVLCYFGGRVADSLCPESNRVTVTSRDGVIQTEIEVYAASTHAEFRDWLKEARLVPEQRKILALLQAGKATDQKEARRKLAESSLREILIDAAQEKELGELTRLVDDRLKAGLAALKKNADLSSAERQQQTDTLHDAAGTVRAALRGQGLRAAAPASARAVEAIISADPAVDVQQRALDQRRLTTAIERLAPIQQVEELKPRGPFRSLLSFEMRCFGAAIQGVCNGRWGFQGRALDAQPAMCGSIESALRGLLWMVNQHGWYTLLFALYNLLIFAHFGGAICRSAAMQSAREENISIGESLAFVRQRFGGFILAPLLPAGVFIGIALLMFVGGLIGGLIPYLGELAAGIFYPLALLGSFALAVVVLATVLGFHLMWPTIAVEGSDGFDALSRACSYVGSRIWHVGFYSFVLLLYGGVSFVFLRVLAVLTLKLSHKFTGAGMNLFSSAKSDWIDKLNAMWSMPAWADLSLLPNASTTPLWGSFRNSPLDATESVGAFLIALWVFLIVGLLAAFVVSFFFCGSTQMYFLLRRDVDATDWEEVYYEETEEELPVPEMPGPSIGSPAEGTTTPGSPPTAPDGGTPPAEPGPPAGT